MEHKYKRLHQLLESLICDSELKSWTMHNNKFGTSVTIRFASAIPSVQSEQPMPSTREAKSESSGPEDIAHNDNDITSTRVFKPASRYSINRDKQRMKDFIDRRTTRSQSRANEFNTHSELPRNNDICSDVMPSDISPVAVEPITDSKESDELLEMTPAVDICKDSGSPHESVTSGSDDEDSQCVADCDSPTENSTVARERVKEAWERVEIHPSLGIAFREHLEQMMEESRKKYNLNISTNPMPPNDSVT